MSSKPSDEVIIPGYLKASKIAVWVMYFWVTIGIISLFLRVILLALSANTANGFANLVANTSSDYLEPFRGIFPAKALGETGYLDVSAIFAIIVYLFISWGFRSLIEFVQNKIDLSETEQKQAILKAERDLYLKGQTKRTNQPNTRK